MSKFERPIELAFPQTYYTFKAKNKAGNANIEYQVRDLPEDLFEEALDLLSSNFATEETLCVSKKVVDNPLALSEMCIFWFFILSEKISVGCFANDGSDELVGVALLSVLGKDDTDDDLEVRKKEIQFNTMEMLIYAALTLQPTQTESKELLEIWKWILNQHNAFGKYSIDKYLTDFALCTKKEFRQRGIGTEMIKARTPIMKALNVSDTSTLYTVIGSQKAAEKAGHKLTYQISYKELHEKYPTFDFSKSNAEFLKIMDFKMQ